MTTPKQTENSEPTGDDEKGATPEQSAEDAAERKFVEDTLIRGEAAEADEEGKLPAEATHEIVEQHEGEPPKIKRRRFKAF